MRYEIIYKCLWDRYVIVLDNHTGLYNRYDINNGKHTLTMSSADADSLHTMARKAG